MMGSTGNYYKDSSKKKSSINKRGTRTKTRLKARRTREEKERENIKKVCGRNLWNYM